MEAEMPAIMAYKANGMIMPVNDAKTAKAYQCPWTKKVFATKRAYSKHLKELRNSRMHQAARQRITNRKFDNFINQPDFESIINWFETNPEFFFDKIIKSGHSSWGDRRAHIRDEFWVKITYLDLSYSDSVSITHSAPRGKRTNWAGRETLADGTPAPRGYPGWHGKIEYQMSHDIGFGSDVMRGTGFNTGTGGGIKENRYGYDCKMFLEDWPGLGKMVNEQLDALDRENTFRAVSGKGMRTFSHTFKYGTPRYFR